MLAPMVFTILKTTPLAFGNLLLAAILEWLLKTIPFGITARLPTYRRTQGGDIPNGLPSSATFAFICHFQVIRGRSRSDIQHIDPWLFSVM